MSTMRLDEIKQRIKDIKDELAQLGSMRPGAISQQYRNREQNTGLYYQLSYSHQGKSRTKHVRPHEVSTVRRQIETYKRFRQLTDEWVLLALEECELLLLTSRNQEKES